MEQSFGERASERRARKTALILLGAAVLSGLVFLLFGCGPNGMAAALTSMPVSYTHLFIGDGMGTAQIQSARFYQGTVTNNGAITGQKEVLS